MAKTKMNGNWVLTLSDDTPESERQVERDDPLFDMLQMLFNGQQTKFDLESIAAAKGLNPEDVFMDLHENYGYICIGTGENPACHEKLSAAEKQKRQSDIENALEAANIPHILIKGKYMGTEENSFFIPFNDSTIGLSKVLKGAIVNKVKTIAEAHNQDSLLICQKGCACYLYTSGNQKGMVVTGKSAVVYPGKEQLPDDCFSLFIKSNNDGSVGFTCGLNFDRIYTNIDEYAAEGNKTLQDTFSDFVTTMNPSEKTSSHKKTVVILRGTDGYNRYASQLKTELLKAGIRAGLVGSDANIAKINAEVAEDNKTNGPKANWQWPDIRNEFIKRNKAYYDALLQDENIDVVVYADMNKILQFIEPYVKTASDNGHTVVIQVVNSFVFEPGRTNFTEQLCNQYGAFMGRHLADFKKPEAHITDKQVSIGGVDVQQLQGIPASELARLICSRVRDMVSLGQLSRGSVETMFPQESRASRSAVLQDQKPGFAFRN